MCSPPRTKFRNDVLWKVPSHVLSHFQSVMLVCHSELPVIVSEENAALFKAKHGRDLLNEFDVNEYGLSRVACLCAKCPYFKVRMGNSTLRNGQRHISPMLYEHISSCVEGIQRLHSVVHRVGGSGLATPPPPRAGTVIPVVPGPRADLENNIVAENDILAELMRQCMLYRVGEETMRSTLHNIRAIRTPVPFEEFERHFV